MQKTLQEHQATIGLISDSSVIPSVSQTPCSPWAHSQEDSIIAMSLLDPQPHPPPLLGFSGMARSSLLVSSNFLRPALASVLAGGEASFRPPTGPLLPTHSFGQNQVTVFWNPLELSTPLIESQVLKCSQTHRLLPSSCHL